VSSFLSALQLLTVFPWPQASDCRANEIGSAAIFFPVVGFLLGSILVLANFLLRPFASAILVSVVVVTLLALLTRGLHLDGLGDTFDGLGAGGERQRMLRIMDDSHTGAFGLIAIVLVLFFKIHAIEGIDSERWRALLSAPVLSRWAMVLLGHNARPAKQGLGSTFIDNLSAPHVFLATLITAVLVIGTLHGPGIALMGWVAVFTIASRAYFHRRLGGVTGDSFGAVGELSETSVLFFLALGMG
jgi:adenosylcobinamide-GDP ribazoletransferase